MFPCRKNGRFDKHYWEKYISDKSSGFLIVTPNAVEHPVSLHRRRLMLSEHIASDQHFGPVLEGHQNAHLSVVVTTAHQTLMSM